MFAYRCRHTGLYFPDDYVKEWGKKYGIGMGPRPVSECLDTHYECPKAPCHTGEEMHPVGVCYADVDLVDVAPEEFASKRAILHRDDPNLVLRSEVLLSKQKERTFAEASDRFQQAKADRG